VYLFSQVTDVALRGMFYAEVNLQPDRWFIRFQQLSYKIPDARFDLAHRMITSPEDLGCCYVERVVVRTS
jgi:hypothetical protein